MRSRAISWSVAGLCVFTTCILVYIYREIVKATEAMGTLTVMEYSWFFRLILNLVGYGTIVLPGFIIYKYLEKTNYFNKISNPTIISRCLFSCFGDTGERIPDSIREDVGTNEVGELVVCFCGLMAAYLVWGLLQEKIMTQNYIMSDGSLTKFGDSQFLVFINRFSAFTAALVRLKCTGKIMFAAPLYKFSFCSLTNIMSAWCQYEALKYVSFPTQVLSKSCKVIPVMLMGKLVSGNKYEIYEYVTAALISMGMVMFMLGAKADYSVSGVMTLSGILLLSLYMMCDSFTSSWQGQLFKQYRVSPLQMMCAVNLFSCLLTGTALAQQPTTAHSISLLQHPVFLSDCIVLSVSSAIGQLMIYRTISKFGAVVFTIIMTLRQAVSILLSCLVYGHSLSGWGITGIIIVFASVYLRVYGRQRKIANKNRDQA